VTATKALANATLPYLVDLAVRGPERAAAADPALAGGINTLAGHVVNPVVADALHLPAAPAGELWRG
jgi:alanine dehydrogenase